MPNYLNPLRHLYSRKRWHRIRAQVLAREPLCQRCLARGKVTASTVVNHSPPHEGDEAKFWDTTSLQALCAPCHDGPARKEETGQRVLVDYDTDIGSLGFDGWPMDPDHPANRGGRDGG